MNRLPLVLALLSTSAAEAGFIDLVARAGGTTVMQSTANSWNGPVNVGGIFTVEDIGGGTIFQTGASAPGLTNTRFTCISTSGCAGFGFDFTILGWDLGGTWPITLDFSGVHSMPTDVRADFILTCGSSIPCPFNSPAGTLVLQPTFSEVSGTYQPDYPPNTVIAPGTLGNLQIFVQFTPVGGGNFPTGGVLDLPSSFTVQAAPEPGTMALFVMGLLGLAAWRRGQLRSRCGQTR